MNSKSLRVLELDKILERLAAYCAFTASAELARALEPATVRETVTRHLAETTEARSLLDQNPQMGIRGARDIRVQVQAARKGAILQPLDLLDVRGTLLAARSLRRSLVRLEATFPHLAFIAGSLGELVVLVDAITRTVNDRGEILDDASDELARIRRELNVARTRMIDRLQRYINSSDFAKVIQEPIITQRDGRYVIPIRSEARGRINGIVHDASASGATLFVEPMAVVELGNTLRELQAKETREIERILRELSLQVADEGDALTHTVEALAELDLAFAKAHYSAALRATEPKIAASALNLIAARHPLLDPETVVPITISLGETFTILVITGPNTGGKTVTLKTVGLLAAMAQCGMHIPAQEGSRVPVFDGVYADIGDEQSIEQSLSTFSSHLSNLVEILREADANSLVLLDELGAGTDPIEGAALARAVLQHLLARKIPTLVATHYAELKAFAHSTPDVENASMEFNVETLRPTFNLQIGLPGRSNAFAIAARLNLDANVIESARALMSTTQTEFETMLAEIRKAKEEAARELRRAEQARENSERAQKDARQQLIDAERQHREILEQARREAQMQIDATRAELNELKKEWRQVKLTRDFIERAEDNLDAVEDLNSESVPIEKELLATTESSVNLGIGDRVFVSSLRAEGEIVGLGHDGVDVQLGSLRAHLPFAQVELRGKFKSSPPVGSSVVVPEVESPGVELHLRMMRAEDALDRLEKYLDRAYLAGLPYVRIVHGKGTGTLRRLVRETLSQHPLVREVKNAEQNEGGEGVTIAMLVSR